MRNGVLLCFLVSSLYAETLKTVDNPFSSESHLQYITQLDSTTLPSGSTQYIQNSFTPSVSNQVFSVRQGSYSATGFVMTDSTGCQWDTTINTGGAVVTTLRAGSCPAVAVFRPCTTGMSLGILLAVTCP